MALYVGSQAVLTVMLGSTALTAAKLGAADVLTGVGSAGNPISSADLLYYPIYGQSLSLGSDPDGGTVISAADSTHRMFTAGVRVHYNTLGSGANENAPVDPDNFAAFLTLAEVSGITVGSQFGETLASGMGAQLTRRSLFATTGRGAYTVEALSRANDGFTDMNHYMNTYAAMLYAARRAEETGWTMAIPAFIWKQGEADAVGNTSKADWKAGVIQMRDDLRKDAFAAAFIDDDTIPLMTDQLAYRQDGRSYGDIAVAALEMHRDGDVLLVGPTYDVEFTATNDVHFASSGYREHGERYGWVIENYILEGEEWNPCHITAASRVGTTITLTVHVPVAPLVKDTSTFSALSLVDDGFAYSGANITAVAITDDGSSDNTATIEITIDADASGTLQYAYENAASDVRSQVGGHIRDSSAAVTENSGKNLWNWLCTDEWSIA